MAGIQAALVKTLPIPTTEDVTEVQVQLGQAPGPARTRQVHRFSSRDKRTSVAFSADSFSVETTAYSGWDTMRLVLEQAAAARFDVAPVVGIDRIGLRYIDEIRIPGESEPDWSLWVDASLAAPRPCGLRPQQQQSVVQYATQTPGDTLTLRYGAVNGPSVIVSPTRPAHPFGHFFLLDTDAAWTLPPDEDVPEATVELVRTVAERLHRPVKDMFEALLTEKLRSEVLDVD